MAIRKTLVHWRFDLVLFFILWVLWVSAACKPSTSKTTKLHNLCEYMSNLYPFLHNNVDSMTEKTNAFVKSNRSLRSNLCCVGCRLSSFLHTAVKKKKQAAHNTVPWLQCWSCIFLRTNWIQIVSSLPLPTSKFKCNLMRKQILSVWVFFCSVLSWKPKV